MFEQPQSPDPSPRRDGASDVIDESPPDIPAVPPPDIPPQPMPDQPSPHPDVPGPR